MIDLKIYRSLRKDNSFERSTSKDGLADELGPEAMEQDVPPDASFELLLPLTIKEFNLRKRSGMT
jgi:hypothetical protein